MTQLTLLNRLTGRMAWCGLIALHLARKDGLVSTEAQENLFLTRWLSTVLKQKRFPREVARILHGC